MSQAARLVITHGTTDLQLLLRCTETGRLLRATPDKALVRRWHHWLRGQLEQGQACVVDLPAELERREHEATISDFADEQHAHWLQDYSTPVACPERNADGKLQLLLPKIQPALSHWLKQHAAPAAAQADATAAAHNPLAAALQRSGASASKPAIERVLVLSTNRGENEQQEPIATPAYLRHWLEHTHGLLQAQVEEFIFLGPGERLESATSPIDPGIAQRLEEELRAFYPPGSKARLLLAHEGGLPQIKPLLDEYAALLAPERTVRLLRTERGSTGVLGLTPIDALRTRRLCLEHVRRGNLLDAYACAAPFHADTAAQRWVQPLEQAASLINGNPIGSVGNAATLPALQAIIEHAQQASCLLVALRVESALQGQRWLEAINGSLTFVEAALSNAVGAWVKQQGGDFNQFRRGLNFNTRPARSLPEYPALEPWAYGDRQYQYRVNIVGEKATPIWCRTLKLDPLLEVSRLFYEQDGWRLVNYRNYNTHGVLDQQTIDTALKSFMGANIWSQGVDNPSSRPKAGKCFLDRALIKAVLQLFLPNCEPAQLYSNLLQELEQHLIAPAAAHAATTPTATTPQP